MKLDFKILKQHHDFIKCDVNAMIVGGYGSAKSHTGTIKTILKKLEYPNHPVAYYLPTYPLIQDIAFEKFPEILNEYGLNHKLNESKKEIEIFGYGLIKFRSMDRPDNIVGYESAYSLIDEADILPADKMDKVYKKILGRNRAVENAIVDVVSTPEGYKWLYEQSLSGNFKVFKARTKDNKFLPKRYIEELEKQYPPALLRAYLEGDFVNLTAGAVYTYFDRKKNHATIEIDDTDEILIGQDFNVGGNISIMAVEVNDELFIFGESSNADTFHTGDFINETFGKHHVEIYPDASGRQTSSNSTQTDIQILEQKTDAWIVADKVNPRVKDRINSVNAGFYHKKIWIDTDKCPKLTEALERQAYTDKGEPEKFSGAGTIDDYTDPLGYLVHKKMPVVKPSWAYQK